MSSGRLFNLQDVESFVRTMRRLADKLDAERAEHPQYAEADAKEAMRLRSTADWFEDRYT